MIRLLRTRLHDWRRAALALCVALVAAQSIALVHVSDVSKHADGTACQICLAIGPAAGPPAAAKAPAAQIVFETAKVAQVADAVVHPTFSPHVARGPPTSL